VAVFFIITLLLSAGCSRKDKDKIPITTSSKQARELFLEGRDLFEKLRFTDSRPFFEKAVAEDPDFALGYLFLAQSVPSAKGFFENLDKAVALADSASESERLWILGLQAGAHAMPLKQREYYQQMTELCPKSERALNLLGNNYFGQQEYELAIEQYDQAIVINPDFSQPYNQLGYAHRFLTNYTEAEAAFQKYIELIPDDPNPYDSYAELLLKMGRYDESITNYQKALEINPYFVASHVGIATNYNLKENYEAAREQLGQLFESARDDGERRAAHFAMTVSYVDQGDTEKALEEQEKQYALAEKIGDAAAMAGDLVTMGDILLQADRPTEAMAMYEKALQTVENSDRSEEVKNNTRRNFLFNSSRVAMKKGQLDIAKAKAGQYRQQAVDIDNPFLIKLAHQLFAMIALEAEEFDTALEELQKANLQNPHNLYRMGLAYQGMGDLSNAREQYRKAATFNVLNSLQYGFIRHKAREMSESL
jgi:tetratricopeptide (TPR) repeat protein